MLHTVFHCRRIKLERKLQEDALSEEEKRKQREALQQQERDYFRLQRQRLSSNDFEALKLIGRGAFGEVCSVPQAFVRECLNVQPWPQTCI